MYFSVLHQFLLIRRRKRIWSVSHFRHGKTKYCPHFVLGDDAYCSNLACDWHWFWHSFSKLAELGMLRLMHAQATYSMQISPDSILFTITVFGCIFILLFFNALRQIHFSGAISLIRSENVGEKPPKGNWILGILGLGCLVVAYYLAVTVADPVSALGMFFIAVILVIFGTYLIMIAGSVLFVVCYRKISTITIRQIILCQSPRWSTE